MRRKMSVSGSDSPERISTSSYEQQVIIDLQTRLSQLAQQNRESIAKALSATEATRSVRSQAPQPVTADSVNFKSLPPTIDVINQSPSFPLSLLSGTNSPAILAEDNDNLHDQHPLTLSKSTPATSAFIGTDGPLPVPIGENHHMVYSAGGLVAAKPFDAQLKDVTQPVLPVPNPAKRNLLAKQLEDSKAQVFHLDTKLKECNDICEQQKLHFRTAIVDLQTKLNNTVIGRNSVLELRRKEAESQERLINQLQKTFTDVEASNHQQAQVLQDASHRVSTLYSELQACNATLTQVIALAISHATNRGLTLKNKTTYSGHMDLGQVVNVLKEVLEYYDKELQEMLQKAGKAEHRLKEAKEQFAERWKQNGEEQKQMLRNLREEQEKQLSAATERALNARKQTLSLQSQLALTQEQMQEQLKGKTRHVTELQRRLEELQEEAEHTRNTLQAECDTLSSDLEAAQQQHRISAEEKSQLHDQIQSLEQQLREAKESAAKVEADRETIRDQNRHLSSLEKETSIKLINLRTQLEGKTSRCEELCRLMEEVKQESVRQAEERILTLEANSKYQINSITDNMSAQISDITHEYNALKADLKEREQELDNVLKSREDLAVTLAEVRQELQQVTKEKMDTMLILDERGQELEAVQKEKEHVVLLLEERNQELGAVQSVKDQLQVQVNEKDEQCLRLQEQTSSMAQLAEVTRKASEDWKQESSQMKEMLDGQAKELQDSKLQHESLTKKLKIREKRLRTMEEENKRLQETAQGTARESEMAARSREQLKTELQQAKTQLDLMTIEGEKLKVGLIEKDYNHQKDVSNYQAKIQALHWELQVAHRTIKATAAIDGKAVKVAESMQKQVTAKRSEIDTLQSEIHWLKECLDIFRKEKSALLGDRDCYKTQVSEMMKKYENLLKEQKMAKEKRTEQSSLVAKLEESLKKAAKKHAECQAISEIQEQDIARLKLKHQLEIKEVQRASARTSPPSSIPFKPSCQKSTPFERTPLTTSKGKNAASVNRKRMKATKENSSRVIKSPSQMHTKGLTRKIVRSGVVTTDYDSSQRNPQRDMPQSAVQLVPSVSIVPAEWDMPCPHKGTQTSTMQRDTSGKLLTDEDLRSLLCEMYNVVSGRPNVHKDQSEQRKASPSPGTTSFSPANPITILQEDRKVNTEESGYSTRPRSRQGKAGMTAPLLTSSPVRDNQTPKAENLSFLSSVPATGDSVRVTPEPDFLLLPRSPVASLLGVSLHDKDHRRQDNNSHNNKSQTGSPRFTSFESMERSKEPDVDLDSGEENGTFGSGLGSSVDDRGVDMRAQKEQLKLLQDKLQRLGKIGGHLQKENKDMAIMIKRQDTRLKKCRQQEQSVQQLARKGR